MKTIELLGNRDEVVILYTALVNLMDIIEDNGNAYGMHDTVADLLEQVTYIKNTWEEN